MLAKYLEHMPLHRLEQSFKLRYGVNISRKTMADGFNMWPSSGYR
jgi:hypothetical protein